MQVKVQFGPKAGSVVEYPHHVGLALVEAGRGTRVDVAPSDAPVAHRATATVPALLQRDPVIERPTAASGARRRRRPR